MPAVRMISVCPMAITPTTITCCRISERFSPVRKRSVWVAKNAQASEQREERAERAERRQAALAARHAARSVLGYFLPQHSSMPVLMSLLSTPATGLAAISVTPVSV